MTGESRYCQNCRRDIAAANYVIHSAHCERKIQLCTICNEPVPRTEIDQHLDDSHSYEACELCGIGVEKWLMDKHKNTCVKRPFSCEFCELDFPFDELDEHKDMCGARTEKCGICKSFVKLKDQHEHRKACQREWEANLNSVKCESCRKSIPTCMFHSHVSVCGSQSEKCPKCGDFVLIREKNMHICKGRIIDCEYCDVSMPTDVFSQHISLCGSQIKNCPKCNVSFMQRDRKTHQCQSLNKSFGTCSICQQNVSWIDLREHESACRLVTYSGSDEDEEEEKPKFSAIPMHQKRQPNYRQIDERSPQKRMQETPNIRRMNQCHYCKERFPDLIIKDHLEKCPERPSKCELCLETILPKDKLTHAKRDCKMLHGNKSSYSTVLPGYTKSFEMKMNLCPYCKERFPDLIIKDHLEGCLERPSKCELCFEIILLKDQLNHQTRDCKMIHGNENSNSTIPPGYTTKSREMKVKQCSYCSKKFPEIMFQDHLMECEECPYQCRLCLKMMPVKNKINHDIRECNGDKVTKQFSDNENNYSGVASGYTRSYEKRMKPCTYCHKKIPELMFQEHSDTCEERPYQCDLCLKMMPTRNKNDHNLKECPYKDKKRQSPGSVGTNTKDVPVYQKTFEKGYLENNFQSCPYCNSRISEARIAEHVQCCSEGKTICRFCGLQIPKEQEIDHLQNCIGARNVMEEPLQEFQSAGGKKNKKKNRNKGVQNEPVQQKSNWLSSFWTNRKPPSPVKESPTPTYFQHQMALLPCEFCDELFPETLIIEHQSGCRPDLVSYHKQEKTSHSDERRASPEKDSRNFRDVRSTGALPKRNRFNQNDPEVSQGPFFYHQNPPKEPTKERDYYNYPSGVPDYSMQSNVGAVKPTGKKMSPDREATQDNKASCKSEEKKMFTKIPEAPIFNFSSSSKKSTSNRPKPPVSIYSSPSKKGYSDELNTEIKAVGAERAERKGIIRMSRDTPMNLRDLSDDEAPDKYDTNYQVQESSQNSENKFERRDFYSQERFNIPCENETSNIIESGKVKSSCAARLLQQQLNNSDVSTNNPEPWDVMEDDAKNEETFGNNFNPRENRSLSNESDNLSDSGEHFYDAEDNLKVLNVESEGSTFMDQSIDVYLEYLMKNESVTPNDNRNEISPYLAKKKTLNCQCGNEICYCDIINRTNSTENNNLQAEAKGHLQQENVPSESLNLNACSNEMGANNFQSEKTGVLGDVNHVNNAGVEKPSPKWDKWRSNNIHPSDSE